MGICRLRKLGMFPIQAFAVISEESMIPLCEKYDIRWKMYKNEPLGEKKNFGISEALKLDWDYLIEIGSDDVLKDEYLEAIKPELGKRDFFGINHVIYINSEDGACRRFATRHSFGMGRVMSRKLIETVGKLWDDKKDRGMDNGSNFKIQRVGFLDKQIRTTYPLGIDIKSAVNIWPFNYLTGAEYTLEEALNGLSDQEIEAICSIIKNKSENLIDA